MLIEAPSAAFTPADDTLNTGHMKHLPPDLVLGDARLDEHHAFLFALLQSAEQQTQTVLTSIELASLVKAMLLYALQHFVHEEALMAADQWPGLAEHKRLHLEFRRKCEELIQLGHNGHKSKSSEWRVPVGGLTGGLTSSMVLDTLRSYLREQISDRSTGDAAYVAWRRRRSGL